MKHLMKRIAGLVAVLAVVGGTVAAPSTDGKRAAAVEKAEAGVAVSPNQRLDHLLQGKAAPDWSDLIVAAFFDPRPFDPGTREFCRATKCLKGGFTCSYFQCSSCLYDVSTGWGKCSGGSS
ncbi:MAG: hypothetical protein OXH15_17085 [Gammaproteobacteria bacterium]|nr:hypothetical protein [Gammaproteobacteria bacterium]